VLQHQAAIGGADRNESAACSHRCVGVFVESFNIQPTTSARRRDNGFRLRAQRLIAAIHRLDVVGPCRNFNDCRLVSDSGTRLSLRR